MKPASLAFTPCSLHNLCCFRMNVGFRSAFFSVQIEFLKTFPDLDVRENTPEILMIECMEHLLCQTRKILDKDSKFELCYLTHQKNHFDKFNILEARFLFIKEVRLSLPSLSPPLLSYLPEASITQKRGFFLVVFAPGLSIIEVLRVYMLPDA